MKEVARKCLRELAKYSFEQMNFNLYDLTQCDTECLHRILAMHKESVQRGVCKGQSNRSVRSIVSSYNDANSTHIEAEEYVTVNLSSISELAEEEESEAAMSQLRCGMTGNEHIARRCVASRH